MKNQEMFGKPGQVPTRTELKKTGWMVMFIYEP